MSTMTRRDHLALLATGSVAAGFALGGTPAAAQAVRWSSGTEKPRIAVPANATDCHHHIYDARFPPAPAATLRPPDASIGITARSSAGSGSPATSWCSPRPTAPTTDCWWNR